MTEKVRGVWDFLASLFRSNPSLAAVMAAVAAGGWFLDRHPQFLDAILESSAFSTVPSGWLVLAMLLMCWWIYLLSKRVETCQRNCDAREVRYMTEGRALRTGIGRMILLIGEDHREEAAEVMAEIDEVLAEK